jgi:hypothetical protein
VSEEISRGLSLIFPVADGAQTEFRGFETVGGESLVRRSLRSFLPFRPLIAKVFYIVLEDHAAQFDIARRLAQEIPDLPFEIVTLASPTRGPAETVARGVAKRGIEGAAIVCDIDHRIDPAPLFRAQENCLVSLWPLAGEDLKRWSVACAAGDGSILGVAERRLPAAAGFFHGVIGCYRFGDIRAVMDSCLEQGFRRFGEYFNWLAARGAAAHGVVLESAEFFGDAERIRALEEKPEEFRGTIFCDLDGTLIVHEDKPDYSRLPQLLPGSREKLHNWIAEKYCVVLCTARAREDEPRLVEMLRELNIPYHRIITGLPSGIRIVINDRKPYAMFTAQAASLEVARDQGIAGIELLPGRRPQVLRRFPGGSFAETLLVEEAGKVFVRKRAAKDGNLSETYHRLRDQYRTLERFAQLAPDLVPGLYAEENNSHEYFYDMEFLDGHEQLAECGSTVRGAALDQLLDRFDAHLYSQKNRSEGASQDWFLRHLESKIVPKLTALSGHPRLRPLLTGEGARIDGVWCPSLERLLAQLQGAKVLAKFTPRFLSLVHGDLTFQNIMVRGDGAVRVIDMEAQDGLEAPELDLGKLFQSIDNQYESWSRLGAPVRAGASPGEIILNFKPPTPDAALREMVLQRWAAILGCSRDAAEIKAGFYLGLHLIRMVPFRLRAGMDQAVYALATGILQIDAAISRAAPRQAARQGRRRIRAVA